MKVRSDTGWHSLINKALSEKPVEKLEETNPELSQYSSIPALTNVWTANDLWQRKDLQKPQKRHRFPPSLLSSRATDFWKTLMPLRANCSCSSVSVGDKCSRLSFGVSISDATFGSTSNSSVPPVKETAVRETLSDTLENTHLAFKLLIARMVRLVNILKKKSGSCSSNISNGSNIKILSQQNRKSNEKTEIIARDTHCGFPSVTTRSSRTNNYYREYWSARKAGKKCGSSSKFEIAEQTRHGKTFFSPTLLVPKTLRIPKSVLNKEELIYLLQNKKSLLSEYFQRKVDSKDLKKNLNTSERKTFIHGTQSDSRLQEHNLVQFVQFIRARKKKDAEDILKNKVNSLETQKSKTKFTCLNNQDSHHLSIPKRRVTFSDPLAENSTTLLNCCRSKNEDEILSVQSFTPAMLSNGEINSNALVDSKSTSTSDSSVPLKVCVAHLSLNSLPTKTYDPNSDLDSSTIEQTFCGKNITNERKDAGQPDYNDEIKSRENNPCYDISNVDMMKKESDDNTDVISVPPVKKFYPHASDDILDESSSSVFPSSLKELDKLHIIDNSEMMEQEMPIGLKFLRNEILDCGTTHVPIVDDADRSVVPKVGDGTLRVRFKECSPQQNIEKSSKRKIRLMGTRCKYDSIDNQQYTSNCELEHESIRNKMTGFTSIQHCKTFIECDQRKLAWSSSNEQKFNDTDVSDRSILPSSKTVAFQDCCQTISDRSIISGQKEIDSFLQSDDKLVRSLNLTGRFEVSWKGCWDQQTTIDVIQNTGKLGESFTEDEKPLLQSNRTEIPSENVVLTPIETCIVEPNLFLNNHEHSTFISGSQTSYYTTIENEIQLANDYRSKGRDGSFTATSPSSYPDSSNSPSFTVFAGSLKKDDNISWIIKSKEDLSKPGKPPAKMNDGFGSNTETIKLQSPPEGWRRELHNVYKRIRNPEVWRSEVRSEATALSKSNWFTGCGSDRYSWKNSEIRSDWLVRKLEELQSCPETDYESDYYAESEMESGFECERDLSQIKRSFSNLDTHYKNFRKFKTKRRRFGQNIFLNKVLSSKNIIFNECRCHKNTPSHRYDLRPEEHDPRHTSLQNSDQPSNQSFFSHLRARLILDSETDDSDCTPSIQPNFSYNLERKDDHVNKIKCRRFVRSLRSIISEEDRRYSSNRLLHVAFQKSFSPAGVQSTLSTRTVGTNVSEKQNCCSMMDVCIDTYDLCPRKPIETSNQTSDLSFLSLDSSCQTTESFLGTLNSFQCIESVTKASTIVGESDMSSGLNPQISRSSEQRISNAIANLSTQINNTSNNLAKLRFSEVKPISKNAVVLPSNKGDNFRTTPSLASCRKSIERIQSSSSIFLRFSPPMKASTSVQSSVEKSNNLPNNSNSYTVEESRCPTCNTRKKPAGRYLLPACIVKGAGPDSKINEKDPWNRVMQRAKTQHRDEDTKSLEMKSFEKKQNSAGTSNQSRKEEVSIQLVQVKNNSSQAAVCGVEIPVVLNKIPSPSWKYRPHGIPPSSSVCSSKSDDFPVISRRRTRSPRRNKRSQVIANMSNRLLYIISEKAELTHLQTPLKSPATNFFS